MRRRAVALAVASLIALLPLRAFGAGSLYAWLDHRVWFLTGALTIHTTRSSPGMGMGSEAYVMNEDLQIVTSVSGTGAAHHDHRPIGTHGDVVSSGPDEPVPVGDRHHASRPGLAGGR
jgi:hypothetical protein